MDAQLPFSIQSVNETPLGIRASDTRCSNCRPELEQFDKESKVSHSNVARAADPPAGTCLATSSNPATLCSNSQTNNTSVKIERDNAEHEFETAAPNQGVGSQSSAQQPGEIAPTEEATEHLANEVLRALLPQYNTLEANQNSAAEALCVLQRDLLQLRVDRMESKVEQDDTFVSVKRSIAALEESITSLGAQVDRLMHHPVGCGLCAEPKRNEAPTHMCSNSVVSSIDVSYAHSKFVPPRGVQLWNTDEEAVRSDCKRKRSDAGFDNGSKRRRIAHVCLCPVSQGVTPNASF